MTISAVVISSTRLYEVITNKHIYLKKVLSVTYVFFQKIFLIVIWKMTKTGINGAKIRTDGKTLQLIQGRI
jgi:hypothetical protein